jgi:hypothetical protein
MAFNKGHKTYIIMSKLINILSILAFALFFTSGKSSMIERNINNLFEKHGEIFFQALFSISDTNKALKGKVDRGYFTYSILDEESGIDEKQKGVVINTIIRALQNNDSWQSTINKINNWCIAKESIPFLVEIL